MLLSDKILSKKFITISKITTTAPVDPQNLKVEVANKDFFNWSYVINRTCQYLILIM